MIALSPGFSSQSKNRWKCWLMTRYSSPLFLPAATICLMVITTFGGWADCTDCSSSFLVQVSCSAKLYSNTVLSKRPDPSHGWRQTSFLSFRPFPFTDVTGSVNSLGEDEERDCEALASSSLIILIFDQQQNHFNHRVQRLRAGIDLV